MATWRNPVTNWLPSDGVANTDLNRIEENEQYLYDDVIDSNDKTITIKNENVRLFKVGKGTHNSSSVDHSTKIQEQLVRITRVEGNSVIDSVDKNFVDFVNIGHIATTDGISLITDNPDFKPGTGTVTHSWDQSTKTLTVTPNASSTTFSGVTLNLTVEANQPYMVVCDVTDNVPGVNCLMEVLEIISGSVRYIGGRYSIPTSESNRQAMVVYPESTQLILQFFATNSQVGTSGTATFSNMAVYKLNRVESRELKLSKIVSLSDRQDIFANGRVQKKVSRIYAQNAINWRVSDDSKTNTCAFTADLPYCVPVDKSTVSLNCNWYKASTDSELYTNDTEGVAIGGDGSNKLILRIKKADATTVDRLYDFLNRIYLFVEYPSTDYVGIYDRDIDYENELSILVKPGEYIITDSPLPTTFEHEISLNLKSEVDQLQKATSEGLGALWNKFKSLSKVEYNIGTHGYIKLPDAFGGLILQWGVNTIRVEAAGEAIGLLFNYPIKFPSEVYHVGTNCKSHTSILSVASEMDTSKFRINIRWSQGGDLWVGPYTVCWFAIGR